MNGETKRRNVMEYRKKERQRTKTLINVRKESGEENEA